MFRAHAGNVPTSRSTTTPYARYFEMEQGRFIPKTKREAKPKPREDGEDEEKS